MSHASHRPARAHRHERQAAVAAKAQRRTRQLLIGGLVLAGVVVLIAASFVANRGSSTASAGGSHTIGAQAAVGTPVPTFTGRDVLSGHPVTSADLRGKKVLYFFNEGVGCQACMVQIQALQQRAAQLRGAGLTLVAVTNDSPDILRQVATAYRLQGPIIADPNRTLTARFGALGGGMHADTADHTFILVDKHGIVRFHQDYPTMWVSPTQLLASLPTA
jgi:peroxiredoxin